MGLSDSLTSLASEPMEAALRISLFQASRAQADGLHSLVAALQRSLPFLPSHRNQVAGGEGFRKNSAATVLIALSTQFSSVVQLCPTLCDPMNC